MTLPHLEGRGSIRESHRHGPKRVQMKNAAGGTEPEVPGPKLAGSVSLKGRLDWSGQMLDKRRQKF